MVIKLCYDGPYGGHYETVAFVPGRFTDAMIERRLFPEYIGLAYNEDCSYEILEETEVRGK